MALPPVAAGDPHAVAHNEERSLINQIQDVTDPTFKAALDAEISEIAPVESVNNQVGPVVLDAADVGAATPADVTAASTEDRKRTNHSGVQPAASISDLMEAVQDILGSSLAAGSNMSMSYDDATGVVTLSAIVDGAAINTDPEVVRDTIGNALAGSGLISVTVNDAGDTITISTTATANRSDAATDLLLADKLNKTKLNGGIAGQALVKNSSDDQDYSWLDMDGGGFDPATFKGVYSSATAYLEGESVLLDGKVYVANTDLAAGAGERQTTYIGSWSDDNAVTNTYVEIVIPAGAVQEGDLLLFYGISGINPPNFGGASAADWVSSTINHPNGGYAVIAYRYATASDAAGGFTFQLSNGYTGSSGMIRAYRNGMFRGLAELRSGTSNMTPAAAANSFGSLRSRLQVNFFLNYTASSYTIATSWAGVVNTVSSEVSPFDAFVVHAADKLVSAASTDWAALTGFTVTGSTNNNTYAELNIYDELDPADWTYSEALTAMLVVSTPLLAKISRDTSGGASTTYTTSSTTSVAMDATNLAISFVAPASGKVRIDASLFYYTSGTTVIGFIGLHTGGGAYVPGSNQAIGIASTRVTPHWIIEGLTPGTIYTYRLAFAVSSGTLTVQYGGNTTTAGVTASIIGPIQMEVWEA